MSGPARHIAREGLFILFASDMISIEANDWLPKGRRPHSDADGPGMNGTNSSRLRRRAFELIAALKCPGTRDLVNLWLDVLKFIDLRLALGATKLDSMEVKMLDRVRRWATRAISAKQEKASG